MDCSPPGSSVHEISQQEYWSGCYFFLQGIFQTQGLNLSLLCLLHWQACSLPLGPPENPKLGYVSFSFQLIMNINYNHGYKKTNAEPETQYHRPSLLVGSGPADSINSRLKIFRGKKNLPESFKKQNFKFATCHQLFGDSVVKNP